MRIRASGNKLKAMWDLIEEELGKQKKVMENIEISMNGAKIQDPKTIANVFNEYYSSIAQNILCGSPLAKGNGINSVKPLCKKGCDTYVRSYRPVSLISVFSKIIEKAMHKRLLSFLNNHNIINNKQHGFRKGTQQILQSRIKSLQIIG
jgi:hypothetical protein